MTTLLLIGALLSALGVAAYYGYKYAQSRRDARANRAVLDAQKKVSDVLARAVEREKKFQEKAREIDAADGGDLTDMYNKFLHNKIPGGDTGGSDTE